MPLFVPSKQNVIGVAPPSASPALDVVRALVSLSRVDLLYADHYLDRAEELLTPVCPRARYEGLLHDREELPRLTNELQVAAERADWTKVRGLAERAEETRERVAGASPVLAFAEAVYGPRLLHVDATTLALSGVIVQPAAHLERERDAILADLRALVETDAERASFYRGRLAQFQALHIVPERDGGAPVASKDVQAQIRAATQRGDFIQVRRLADAMITEQRGARPGRVRVPVPADLRVSELAASFPEDAVARARRLGFTLETLDDHAGLNQYLGCYCADRVALPDSPLSETYRHADARTCGHACPPEVHAVLRDNLDLLLLRPFVTSAGNRYLPWFGREALLVETFPESEPDAQTEVLRILRLAHRRGQARTAIEDALSSGTNRLCAELGLDPREYVVANIPFDAYLRLAPRHGWGQRELWTHFDGYQLTKDLSLRALVGGDVRYGGPEDLCSIDRLYDTEHLTMRLAVVRRHRFLARDGGEGSP